MSEKIARCLICNEEFTQEELKGASSCPKCENHGVPASPKEDVTIKINWHELRILAIWAENWARQIEKNGDVTTHPILTVNCIARRIQKQHPDKTPLTLSGEIEELKKTYPSTEPNFETKQDRIAGEFNA